MEVKMSTDKRKYIFQSVKNGHHGLSYTETWNRWQYMIRRCEYKSATGYENYGQRGIRVCKRWYKFTNFLKDMGEIPTKQHSLERVNNNKGYSPSNCVWSTKRSQDRNRRNTQTYLYKGQQMILRDIAEIENINFSSLRWKVARSKYKISIEKAIEHFKGKENKNG